MQKKAFSRRDMHSLKRNISFHRFAAVGSADVSGRYSVLSSPSCRNALSMSSFSSACSSNHPAYSCQSCAAYSSSSPL